MQQKLSSALAAEEERNSFQPDTYQDFFAYYTGHSAGIYSTYETGAEFCEDGHRFTMYLNIEEIMNKDDTLEWPAWLAGFRQLARHNSTYVDNSGTLHSYGVRIYDTGNQYLLIFLSDNVMFASICNDGSAPLTACSMLRIAKSIQINEQQIRLAYSRDEPVNYYGKKIRLFENVTPENGMISEIMEDTDN